MSARIERLSPAGTTTARHSPWAHVARAAAALAAGMGVGRFVYTPILPLMHTQAGLSAGAGAHLATANYVGYLIGALTGILAPALVRSSFVLRCCLVVLTLTLAGMPATHSSAAWLVLRLLAGIASALIFVIAASSLVSHLREHPAHLPGWAFGGVGAGIALSGLLVLLLRTVADWQPAWWASAALCAALAAVSWNLWPEEAPAPGDGVTPVRPRAPTHRWFSALFVSYTLEGIGYIVAGTFLVAAIGQSTPGWAGSGAWVLVGLAAVPSSALWARLGRRWSRPGLLLAALVVQAVGIALPALFGSVAAALVSAVLFGATFIGVSTLALATGAHLRYPRSVALLTTGYSVGQIVGPLTVAPLLHHGYRQALLLAALVVLAAALTAGLVRIGFPHHMTVARHGVPQDRTAPVDAATASTDRT
ncbi:YbfB/YjiJ family MFS transporter [Streptomyces chiangmaiensis]|uniref:YbfB/YjiJ family MFS transporter n=1 Tax=Streptomyces chiangmaiensis TaxID=766497 RepID=A0ABU7FDA8_9ACTN|nr:YbfB/YjiJ family MFS transporter [Streptomyces chiangmaiensis]MED7822043.1 YbfB/YjiJ family MFS transporter [Streptomyces chiangmaiensis]